MHRTHLRHTPALHQVASDTCPPALRVRGHSLVYLRVTAARGAHRGVPGICRCSMHSGAHGNPACLITTLRCSTGTSHTCSISSPKPARCAGKMAVWDSPPWPPPCQVVVGRGPPGGVTSAVHEQHQGGAHKSESARDRWHARQSVRGRTPWQSRACQLGIPMHLRASLGSKQGPPGCQRA